MVVASHFEGRARIRDERLRNERVAASVREALLGSPGVDGVEANTRVGSLLILYSATVTGMERIQEVVSGFLGSVEEPVSAGRERIIPRVSLSIPPRLKRNVVNVGMLASLLLSIVAAIFDLKKLHILTGILFLAFFGDHLYERRQLIFA